MGLNIGIEIGLGHLFRIYSVGRSGTGALRQPGICKDRFPLFRCSVFLGAQRLLGQRIVRDQASTTSNAIA
jgi:hypothetical protein